MKKILFIAAVAAMFCSCSKTSENANSGDGLWNKANPLIVPYSETTTNPKEGKRVLVVSSSPRKGGNTDLLADEFARGAEEVGGKVDKLFLADYELPFLSEEGASSPKDDDHTSVAWRMVERFMAADVVVLASPVYYMNVNDRMKTFIDATFLAWADERTMGKEYYYITACAQAEETTAECAFQGFRGLVWCLPNSVERGYVLATSMGRKGAVVNTPYMQQAYELGKTINKQ